MREKLEKEIRQKAEKRNEREIRKIIKRQK